MSDTLKGKMGIYQIVNLIDGKKYVGSSNNLYNRKSSHFCSLRNNKHGNCYLQRAFNKHGEDNFSFEVIEFVDTIDKLLPREQYYIELYQVCDKTKGYNIIVDAVRHTHSKETKQKMSLAKKGKKPHAFSEETRLKIGLAKSKKIICVETGIIYNSGLEAGRLTNINSCNIYSCCTGKQKTAGGYHWQYYNPS